MYPSLLLFFFFIFMLKRIYESISEKIVMGHPFSTLLSGLIWGFAGFRVSIFTHYTVSSGWITSMRLLQQNVFLILSAFQLRRKLVDIWRDKKITCLF